MILDPLLHLDAAEIVTGERLQLAADVTITTRERLTQHRSMPRMKTAVFAPDLAATPEPMAALAGARSIFVYTDMLDAFIANVLPKLSEPVVLITHNSDAGVDGRYVSLLEGGRIRHWFAQNVSIIHPRLTPLPIGLANAQWRHGDTTGFAAIVNATRNAQKQAGLYVNFQIGTNPAARAPIHEALKGKPFAIMGQRPRRRDRLRERLSRLFGGAYRAKHRPVGFREYITDLSRWRFCVSPPGNGLDCHRTWEALYLGVVPVLATPMPGLLDGLPHILVSDFGNVTLESLETAREALPSAVGMERLTLSYWRNRIQSHK